MMNEHIEKQEEKVIMSAEEGRIKRYVVEGNDGIERYISYDSETTLTIVHDYEPGKNLIFKGNEINAIGQNELDPKLENLDVALVVTDEELKESSPLKLWNEMRAKQVNP